MLAASWLAVFSQGKVGECGVEGAISVDLEEEGPCPERPGEALAYFQVEMTASCGGGLSMVWMVRGMPR